MFSNNQLALFNKAYGAYRENLNILKSNLQFVDGEKIEPGMAVIISDIDIQKALFDISGFPEKTLELSEQDFIRSLVEFAGAIKANFAGYGRFFKNMTPTNYLAIKSLFEKDKDLPLILEVAIIAEQRTKKRYVKNVVDNYATIYGSYSEICGENTSLREQEAKRIIDQYVEKVIDAGIIIDQVDNLKSLVYGSSAAEKELYSLIGLNEVKRDVAEIVDLIKLNDIRAQNGIAPIKVSNNMVFTGNPGTGKTTVARLLARIYCELGVLSKGHLVEVDRSKLVGGYLGQTAIKAQEVFKSALGGVLFIDEAYMLSTDREDSYGQEAIDTLLKFMEDNREDIVVIVAGYPELMQRFINSNPGLRSRFNKYIHFSDYNAEELQQIFERMMRKDGYMLSDEAKNKLIEVWKIIQNEDGFGNGRDVRNVYEKVIVRQASRIVNSSSKDRKDLLSIVVDDIPNYAPTKKPPTRTIGF